jgi:hypothetical protein
VNKPLKERKDFKMDPLGRWSVDDYETLEELTEEISNVRGNISDLNVYLRGLEAKRKLLDEE